MRGFHLNLDNYLRSRGKELQAPLPQIVIYLSKPEDDNINANTIIKHESDDLDKTESFKTTNIIALDGRLLYNHKINDFQVTQMSIAVLAHELGPYYLVQNHREYTYNFYYDLMAHRDKDEFDIPRNWEQNDDIMGLTDLLMAVNSVILLRSGSRGN